MGISPSGWSILENTIKMDNLGASPFQETTIHIYINVICSKVLKHPKAMLDGFPPK